ncbi:hypothetical protein [Paenibacillus ginsengihumi]|uniref:hypothetical protein n=1 Tax=Paenibacillus ginsengihumi TaxID=431596 RepID=UPI00036F575A|nr:hypothetical protein [Paenibacillus ginsengihumi]
MMIGLLYILGIYAAGLAIIHWLHGRWSKEEGVRRPHYILITRNNQLQIEWYIRSLFFFSRVKGRNMIVTIVDEGSTDDTLDIVMRLAKVYALNVVSEAQWSAEALETLLGDENAIVVRLNYNEALETAFKSL